MAKQLGRGLLLGLGTEADGDANANDTYTTIAGINSKSLTINIRRWHFCWHDQLGCNEHASSLGKPDQKYQNHCAKFWRILRRVSR